MTQEKIKKIRALRATTIRYAARVQRQGPKTGKHSETAVLPIGSEVLSRVEETCLGVKYSG